MPPLKNLRDFPPARLPLRRMELALHPFRSVVVSRSFCLRVFAFPFGAADKRSLPVQSSDPYSARTACRRFSTYYTTTKGAGVSILFPSAARFFSESPAAARRGFTLCSVPCDIAVPEKIIFVVFDKNVELCRTKVGENKEKYLQIADRCGKFKSTLRNSAESEGGQVKWKIGVGY